MQSQWARKHQVLYAVLIPCVQECGITQIVKQPKRVPGNFQWRPKMVERELDLERPCIHEQGPTLSNPEDWKGQGSFMNAVI